MSERLTEHLFRSFDAMFGTHACDDQLPLNLSVYPRSDAQLQADQDAFERREDRDEIERWDAIDEYETGQRMYGEI